VDRIDMHIEVPRVPQEMLRKGSPGGEESSAVIRVRVMAARQRALQRAGRPNALLTPKLIKRDCALSEDGHKLLEQAIDKLGLSHRAYHRILKLARTIADLEGVEDIGIPHLSEAIGYRRLDRSAPNSRI
jgi:magnesium chelatase family protein